MCACALAASIATIVHVFRPRVYVCRADLVYICGVRAPKRRLKIQTRKTADSGRRHIIEESIRWGKQEEGRSLTPAFASQDSRFIMYNVKVNFILLPPFSQSCVSVMVTVVFLPLSCPSGFLRFPVSLPRFASFLLALSSASTWTFYRALLYTSPPLYPRWC